MKNDEFVHYYGRRRRRSNYILQKNVLHKGKTFQFRADFELRKNIEDLAKELDQADSKIVKDILEDFFLVAKIKAQAEDVNHFISNVP